MTKQQRTMPPLPPPDLHAAFAELPQGWRVGAVLLADRILAAAYREDVEAAARAVALHLTTGRTPGITRTEAVDEEAEGHPRVVDRRLALHALAYSTHAPLRLPIGVQLAIDVREAATLAFALDVEAALADFLPIDDANEWDRPAAGEEGR